MTELTDAQKRLIVESVRFACWGAGEGIYPGKIGTRVDGPEDFFCLYSSETGDEEWETIADRLEQQFFPEAKP